MYPKTGAVAAGAGAGSLAFTGLNTMFWVAAAFTLIGLGLVLTTNVAQPAFAGVVRLFRRTGKH